MTISYRYIPRVSSNIDFKSVKDLWYNFTINENIWDNSTISEKSEIDSREKRKISEIDSRGKRKISEIDCGIEKSLYENTYKSILNSGRGIWDRLLHTEEDR